MKKIYKLMLLLAIPALFGSCNDEWKEEQYQRYISFKSPLEGNGVSRIYVSYKQGGITNYKLPVIVSGSTTNDRDITVHVALDSDSLDILNTERFGSRTDLYYRRLEDRFFNIPASVNIKAGEDISLLNIDLSLQNIDLVDKWVLPLTIVDNPSYDYSAHPRKHYRKALLYVMPFNYYSGTYGGTAVKMYTKGLEEEAPIVRSEIPTYVVNENTIFFYAGLVDENRMDRNLYKIYATFDTETGNITLSSDNPSMEFLMVSNPVFSVMDKIDATRPYLLHRYITISGIDYEYKDYTAIPGHSVHFVVRGTMMMERKINTQIPDEDQAVEW